MRLTQLSFIGTTRTLALRASIILLLASCGVADETVAIDFDGDIRPILRARCHSCHGADKQEAGLRLDRRDRALDGADSGPVIVAGKPHDSELVSRISSRDAEERMPPKGKPLSSREIEVLKKWILAGAPWPHDEAEFDPGVANHWAYQAIAEPKPPRVVNRAWPRNSIDSFILRKLESESVKPSPLASRDTLIRRVHLDLLGLPPTPDQWRRWRESNDASWYAQMVDELLASPHYGERWGRVWLDQARYADSDGYEKDEPRPHAYNWRDWVINALNDDLPFDEFTEQQIAGDLLPGATSNVKLATGFQRNTLTNREGGIDKEEDRVKQVVDRTNTIGTVWLGLTIGCAQCHNHKYDPITQREYYQLYAFFNNADEQDFPLDPTPLQRRDFAKASQEYREKLVAARATYLTLRKKLAATLPNVERALLEKYPDGEGPIAPTGDLRLHLSFNSSNLQNAVDQQAVTFEGGGQPVFSAGRVGQAIELDGKAQRLDLGRPLELDSTTRWTLSAWINYSQGIGGIITKIHESNDFRGLDFTNNNGMLEVHLVDKWTEDSIKVTTESKIKANQWHHVAATYDGSSKASGIIIYVDGKAQKLKVHFDQLSGSIQIDEPFRLGSRRAGAYFAGKLDEPRIYSRVLSEAEIQMLAGDTSMANFIEVARIPPDQRTEEQNAAQLDQLVAMDAAATAAQQRVKQLEANPPKLQTNTGIGLAERESPRTTYIHLRGEFLNKGSEVEIGVPTFLQRLSSRSELPDRLDLARWILDEQNTLTPRVTVNRVWLYFFGRGLVESDQDFGSQGALPSHPRLLDWLASRFVKDWSIKRLHRLIVNSATYRQSSHARPELAQRDPYNIWLARQNRQRVDAETVRDLALATSGLIDFRVGGPSVFPELPPGIVELAFVDVINRGPWKLSEGGDRYRRGLYTFFQRTSPYPMLTLFDAPDSNVSCTRRERSNTPLQALTLWNDPVFMQSARAMARRIISRNDSLDQQLAYGHVLCLGHEPSPADLEDLKLVFHTSRAAYEVDANLTAELLEETAVPEGMHRAEFAAWISVSRVLLNLDGFITRE